MGPFGPFAVRAEQGTDTYVIGYRHADDDRRLTHIRDALLRSFLLAIHRGSLIAEGIIDGKTAWRLDQSTLADQARQLPEALAFYRAITDSAPIDKNLPGLGTVRLYMNIDDSLEKTLHTVTVRKPLMKVDIFKHTSITVKYAAVLECSDDAANKLLRALEPPTHNEWDPGRATDGAKTIKRLKDFVREGLKSRVTEHVGQRVEVKGLARYLPMVQFTPTNTIRNHGRVPTAGDGSEIESSTVQGKPTPATRVDPRSRRAVPVKPTQRANNRVGPDDADTRSGPRRR